MMRHEKRAGFTLLEMMIVLTISVVLIAGVASVIGQGHDAVDTMISSGDMETKARRYLNQIAEELRQSSTLCPDWDLQADSITFNKCLGTDGNDLYWGPPITYSLTLANGETANGSDDNNNDLVDEGRLTRTEDLSVLPAPGWNYVPGPELIRYDGWVEAGDLNFDLNERQVTITLQLSNYRHLMKTKLQASQRAIIGLRN